MSRVLFLLVFMAWPVVSSTDTGARDPLTRSHDRAYADAQLLSPLVERRFALAAAVARCQMSDNHYAFDFALDKFKTSERFILQKAAEAGTANGAQAATDASCSAAVDRLRNADNDLLAKAELLPSR